MRILGIDPGLQSTGFGIIDCDGPRLHYVASGTVRTVQRSRGAAAGAGVRTSPQENAPERSAPESAHQAAPPAPEHAALGDLPRRLKILHDGISEIITRYTPDMAVVEIVFVNVNPQSTLLLGQARGAAIAALVTRDLPVAEYTALQMKKAITGNGRAAKTQIQEMVRRMLHLPGLPGTDAADALGLAITHAHAASMMRQLAQQTPLQRRQHAMLKGGRLY